MSDPAAILTSADRAALVAQCEGNGEYSCCERGITARDIKPLLGEVIPKGTPVGGGMLDVVEAIVRDRLAEAWMDAAAILATATAANAPAGLWADAVVTKFVGKANRIRGAVDA